MRDVARVALGPELETAENEGATLGDQDAVALARRSASTVAAPVHVSRPG